MLLKAFTITGKLVMMQIYDFIYSTNFPLVPDSGLVSFGNIQWFCYEMAAPLSLPMISMLLLKVQFRYIFFFSSFGSILFILPLQFATICKDSQESICNVYIMWTFTIIFSFISGFCKTLLLFSMLYYLSNLAVGREKIIYYSSFYFMYTSILMVDRQFDRKFVSSFLQQRVTSRNIKTFLYYIDTDQINSFKNKYCMFGLDQAIQSEKFGIISKISILTLPF